MILKRVRYQNFRNIASADISFSPGINLFCGNNAQGKTNALEGIYLFAQGRSHRTAKEKDYITYEQDFAKVMSGPYYKLDKIIGGRYTLEQYDDALAAIRQGVPGKMLLYPDASNM